VSNVHSIYARAISEKKLFPITILKDLTYEERDLFGDAGIITLKQLVTKRLPKLNISKEMLNEITGEARQILKE